MRRASLKATVAAISLAAGLSWLTTSVDAGATDGPSRHRTVVTTAPPATTRWLGPESPERCPETVVRPRSLPATASSTPPLVLGETFSRFAECVVVANSATAKQFETVFVPRAEYRVDGLSLSSDLTTAYIGQRGNGFGIGYCEMAVTRVILGIEGPTIIARGVLPSVSPDNTQLAYAGPDDHCASRVLVVRDLRTNEERRFVLDTKVDLALLAWAPDSQRILAGASTAAGWIVDTSKDGAPPRLVAGRSIGWTADNHLIVVSAKVVRSSEDGIDFVATEWAEGKLRVGPTATSYESVALTVYRAIWPASHMWVTGAK